jgi:cell division protein FtsB
MSENRRVKTPRERRRQKLAFWGVAALLVGYAVLGGDYKFHHLLFLTSEKDRVARRIEELRAENAVLADQESRLQGDTLLLEQMAREKGMKKEGEIVYRIVPVLPDSSTTSGEAAAPGPGAQEGGRP